WQTSKGCRKRRGERRCISRRARGGRVSSAGTEQHPDPLTLAMRVAEGPDKTGVAEARLTADGDHATATLFGGGESVVEAVQVLLALEERPTPAPPRGALDKPPPRHFSPQTPPKARRRVAKSVPQAGHVDHLEPLD